MIDTIIYKQHHSF